MEPIRLLACNYFNCDNKERQSTGLPYKPSKFKGLSYTELVYEDFATLVS